MNQEEFLETNRKYRELMDRLGIVTETWSSREAYDPNVPFSEIDRISIFTTEYKDGSKKVEETPRIYSHLMVMCQEVLQDWGYEYYPREQNNLILGHEFVFQHNDFDLPSIYIRHNPFHRDMFKVADDSNYRTITDKHTWKAILDKHIEYLIKRSGNTRMLRELKLRELI
jgi:hypothetical protein